MKLSRERLQREATATGFRPESLEKVIRLISLLSGIFLAISDRSCAESFFALAVNHVAGGVLIGVRPPLPRLSDQVRHDHFGLI
jgi:hypothetical protein